MTRISVLQMTSGIDPERNAADMVSAAERSAKEGASMMFTPEMSGVLDKDRARCASHLHPEDEDPTLAAMRETARQNGIWIAIGSLAVDRGDGKWANRAFVIDNEGNVAAHYDKMHMFDAELDSGETWCESAAYAPGDQIVTVTTPVGRLGLTICYDIRFPALYDALGRRHCDVISIPAAFTFPTGQAHWSVLARARAIECSAYVVAAAQAGKHEDGRTTYGHSLVIDPWGEVLVELGGDGPDLAFAEIDPERIAKVRRQVPSLENKQLIPNWDSQ